MSFHKTMLFTAYACTNCRWWFFYTSMSFVCVYEMKWYKKMLSVFGLIKCYIKVQNYEHEFWHNMWQLFLSYPPVDDRAGPWNTAMNAACVLHITWQLYHIGHVTSIVFHCFQGRPHHLAQLTSLWRHDFSPDTQSATDRRSIFRNLFRSLFNETVLIWRLWRRFAVCSFRTNQTFWMLNSNILLFFQFE